MAQRKGLLERLAEGPVVGDGSMVLTLEKRGYVLAGPWTPQAVIEYPEAVRQLQSEYLRAGSDVIQSCTFFSSDDQLQSTNAKAYECVDLNKAACEIAREVAESGGALVCGGISPTRTFADGLGKDEVQAEFAKQIAIFDKHDVDFLLGEFFIDVEESVWAIEAMKKTGKTVAITMRIGPTGDKKNVSPGDCAVLMARAGADVIGINCQYDPHTCIQTITTMKKALDSEGLKPFLMLQPVGFHCPDAADLKMGYHSLPEFPFALEPRALTRWDVRRYARDAYNAGVSYFGGCCGFEPHHIREIAEELAEERGRRPPGKDKYEPYGGAMDQCMTPFLRVRRGADYWMNMEPSTGRPFSSVFAKISPLAGGRPQ